MKTIKQISMIGLLLLLPIAGCDLTDLNDNPNEPTSDVDYNLNDSRLASVFRGSLPAMDGDDEQRVKSLMVDFYAQILEGGSFSTRNYVMNEDWNQRMFRRVQNAVASMNIVITNLEKEGDKFAKSIGVAKIWRAYVASIGIDYFGPIPLASYKEPVDNPPYVSVQDAYTEFFSELSDATALLDEGTNAIFNDPTASDLIYKGDTDKWKRFANSLRLRLALRLSEVAPDVCATQAAAAIAAGVMESADDNARIPPRADGGWGADYNYTMFQITWGGPLLMTTSFEKLVTGIGDIDWPDGVTNKRSGGKPVSDIHPAKVDPRAPIMFDPAYENGDWKGLPPGLSDTEYGVGTNRTVLFAELGILYNNGAPYKSRPYDVFLYEEVCFLKAEAAARGFIAGNAKDEYEKGVRASFATWGVADKADTYLASTATNLAGTSAAFDNTTGAGNTPLEKIITQKYLALFPDMSMEAWSDKRRLNLPRMDVPAFRDQLFYAGKDTDIRKPENFIKRVQYPQNELTINEAEYNKGVALLGGPDNVTTKVWWDMNANYCTSEP